MTKWNRHAAMKLRRKANAKARAQREQEMSAFAEWVMRGGPEQQQQQEPPN